MADEEAEGESEPDEGVEEVEGVADVEEVVREPRPPRWPLIVAVVVAALSLAVAVAMSFVAVDRDSALDESEQGRQDVYRVAGQFGEALLAYDYQHLDAFRSGVLALATGAFANQFEDAFQGLSLTLVEFEGASQVTVKGVYVGDIGETNASAIVVADRVVSGTGGTRPEPTTYLQLDLVRVDDAWKVDGVTNLNLAVLGDSGTGAPATTTTSTTSTTVAN